MPAFDAILFDLDGTLVDSVADVAVAVNRLLESLGRRRLTEEETKEVVGWGAPAMMEKAFALTGEPLAKDDLAGIIAGYLDFYKDRPAVKTTIYPGVVETLEKLKESGFRLGVCSNKPHVMTVLVLQALDLDRFFDAATGGDNVPHRKPDGRHIHLTLEMMGLSGASAVMVGDSETDVDAAHDARIPAVCVTYGYSHHPVESLGADALIDDFSVLPGVLDGLAGPRP